MGRVLSSRQFWDLMERWRIPDATALELIEFPGKLGASGKRPRFRFTARPAADHFVPTRDRRRTHSCGQRSGLAAPEDPGRAVLAPDAH